MPNIVHQIGVKADAPQVYKALTSQEGLAAWWTQDTTAEAQEGAVLAFRFNGHGPDMKVTRLDPDRYVEWSCVAGPPEWVGTRLTFELTKKDGQTFVSFGHRDWKEETPFMGHCSSKWGVFMMSLKELLETGQGRPFPNDVPVNHSSM